MKAALAPVTPAGTIRSCPTPQPHHRHGHWSGLRAERCRLSDVRMPLAHFDNPKHWRDRAEEARVIADDLSLHHLAGLMGLPACLGTSRAIRQTVPRLNQGLGSRRRTEMARTL